MCLLGDSAKCHAINGFVVPNAFFEAFSDLSVVEEEGATVWKVFELVFIGKEGRKHKVKFAGSANLGSIWERNFCINILL
jgi:hypothetical protein